MHVLSISAACAACKVHSTERERAFRQQRCALSHHFLVAASAAQWTRHCRRVFVCAVVGCIFISLKSMPMQFAGCDKMNGYGTYSGAVRETGGCCLLNFPTMLSVLFKCILKHDNNMVNNI